MFQYSDILPLSIDSVPLTIGLLDEIFSAEGGREHTESRHGNLKARGSWAIVAVLIY